MVGSKSTDAVITVELIKDTEQQIRTYVLTYSHSFTITEAIVHMKTFNAQDMFEAFKKVFIANLLAVETLKDISK